MRGLLLVGVGVTLFLAACSGDDGGSWPSANAPTISNLRVSYSPGNPSPGTVTQIGFIVDVVDADGDWVLGHCQFATGNQAVLPIRVAAGVPASATTGVATCILVAVFQGDETRIDLTVVDQAGHESNVLSAMVTLEDVAARHE